LVEVMSGEGVKAFSRCSEKNPRGLKVERGSSGWQV
jgi:hypothetical protein